MLISSFIVSAVLCGSPDWVTFVDANLATGANDGSSWANAFRGPLGLRDALLAGRPGASKIIWIANGTYFPGPAGSPSTTTFNLPTGTAIFGGFAGGETEFEQRDVNANIAILSGDLPGGAAGQPELASIVTIIDGDWDTGLDGVVLDVSLSGTPANSLANPRRAMTITGGEPIIDHCIIRDGRATKGAGVLIVDSDVNFYRTTFRDNIATTAGGGAFHDRTSDAVFSDCSFTDNASVLGAGLYIGAHGAESAGGAFPSIGGCVFTDNHSLSSGGSGGAVVMRFAVADVERCTFTHCTVGGGGGAMFLQSSNVWISRCTFTDCHAPGDGGGAIHADEDNVGAPSSSQTTVIENCLFNGNNGAVFTNNGAEADVDNCTITNGGPEFASDFKFAALVATGASTMRVTNSIVWGNVLLPGPVAGSALALGGSTMQLDRCDIEHWTGPVGSITGSANFDADPKFVDRDGADGIAGTSDDDLHLLLASPCIDAGNANLTNDDYWYDLDGADRFFDVPTVMNTGFGWVQHLDIGCYERHESACPTDLNGDAKTDAMDLALLLGDWGNSFGSSADLNEDGIVNAADLAMLLGGFGPCV